MVKSSNWMNEIMGNMLQLTSEQITHNKTINKNVVCVQACVCARARACMGGGGAYHQGKPKILLLKKNNEC